MTDTYALAVSRDSLDVVAPVAFVQTGTKVVAYSSDVEVAEEWNSFIGHITRVHPPFTINDILASGWTAAMVDQGDLDDAAIAKIDAVIPGFADQISSARW